MPHTCKWSQFTLTLWRHLETSLEHLEINWLCSGQSTTTWGKTQYFQGKRNDQGWKVALSGKNAAIRGKAQHFQGKTHWPGEKHNTFRERHNAFREKLIFNLMRWRARYFENGNEWVKPLKSYLFMEKQVWPPSSFNLNFLLQNFTNGSGPTITVITWTLLESVFTYYHQW